VLARLEQIGIRVDRDRLGQLSGELGERMTAIETQIYEHAGGPFNIQSPKQLNEILFDKLQYPTKGIKKTKTGQLSTDSDVLEKLALQFPLPKLILEFRTVAKLKGTYVDALPPLIREDGRIHTRFNQLVAVTGRLSSTDPNLQNIPIRDEEGRKIREAFVPAEGNVLMSFDYSQVELRILAHIADDAILQDSFAKSEDVHRRTAAEVFGVMPGLVDANMRRKAKAVNFGIAYGQTAYGLSTALGIGAGEAQGIIDRYFERYQGVKAYLERMPQLAREQGFVSTLFGRRRLLPDIHAGNVQVRQFAERNAINTPIQGTAADMIKLAMIRIDEALQAQGFRSRMMLQVHDELLFDVVPEEQEKLTTLVKELMEGVLTLKVPLVVDVGAGKSWAAAH
jgi:DNA polymerase-1